VLLSDKTILEAPDIEERLANIRRTTGLDPKNSLFFLPPNTSQVELRVFVTSVLSTLQPLCIEYYRDLTKHARRKKSRGTIPPPTTPPTRGTSQTLSYPGWGVRYDFKLGVFAEFRQEMDAAQRHYNVALEALFGPDTTPSRHHRPEAHSVSIMEQLPYFSCANMAEIHDSVARRSRSSRQGYVELWVGSVGLRMGEGHGSAHSAGRVARIQDITTGC
jgi:hypothetical protein